MSEQSAKPYLVRALYEWCVEQGYTPFLAVKVNAQTRVPQAYVNNGEIVLNVSPIATHQLTMDNEWVLFNARFNGNSQEIAIPFAAVAGIFAKETGYGMGFQVEEEAPAGEAVEAEPAADAPLQLAPEPPAAPADSSGSAPAATPPKGRPSLTVVK